MHFHMTRKYPPLIFFALLGITVLMAKDSSPNVIFVLSDQWRASSMGYSGDPNVKTPHLDRLAEQSIDFKNAVAMTPVCGPARATIITGQYPLTSGFFLNDITLNQVGPSIADAFNSAGYMTGYVGKWHLNGRGRSTYIPKEQRQGFQFFKGVECPPGHNNTIYFDNEDTTGKKWNGYDPFAQTESAIEFMEMNRNKPFFLMLSWNPPHAPYLTAPQEYKDLYNSDQLILEPNVPRATKGFTGLNKWTEMPNVNGHERLRPILAGYYAHCSALDHCIGMLQKSIRELELEENTIFVFTSDHGDMMGSHGLWKKQLPYDESIRIPSLFKIPGIQAKQVQTPISHPDLMPTLLALCGIDIPKSVQGHNYAPEIHHGQWGDSVVLIANYQPFGQWPAAAHYEGWPNDRIGREWRGVRTQRYTYVRDLSGPWMLFDNKLDPSQMNNLIGKAEFSAIEKKLELELQDQLHRTHDDFKDGMTYVKRWGYKVDHSGTTIYDH